MHDRPVSRLDHGFWDAWPDLSRALEDGARRYAALRFLVKSVKDTMGMFNSDGKMNPDGARNVLEVLSQFSTNVKDKKASIDLNKTYTTQFVDNVK